MRCLLPILFLSSCVQGTPEEAPTGEDFRISMWNYGWARVGEGSFAGVCGICMMIEPGATTTATVGDCTFNAIVVGACACVVYADPPTAQTPTECWCEVAAVDVPTDPDCATANYPSWPGGSGGTIY